MPLNKLIYSTTASIHLYTSYIRRLHHLQLHNVKQDIFTSANFCKILISCLRRKFLLLFYIHSCSNGWHQQIQMGPQFQTEHMTKHQLCCYQWSVTLTGTI